MNNDSALLVLAGGQSERMGDVKAMVDVKGKSMIKHVIDNLSPLFEEIVISCKERCKKLNDLFPRAKVVEDEHRENGPLIGLTSTLPQIENDYVVVVSCDTPFIKPRVTKFLLKKANGHSGAVPRWPNGYLEPLTAAYKTEELNKAAKTSLKKNKMKLSKTIERLDDVVFVSTEKIKKLDRELKSFTNINQWKDLEKF